MPKVKAQMNADDDNEEEFGDPKRIVVDPDIRSGKPTIRGTWIMVSNILGMFVPEIIPSTGSSNPTRKSVAWT